MSEAESQPLALGSIPADGKTRKLKRTKAGDIPAADLKAIRWYTDEHGFKPAASSTYPQMRFTARDGTEVTIHLADILDAHDEFKKNTRGKKRAA